VKLFHSPLLLFDSLLLKIALFKKRTYDRAKGFAILG